MLEEKDLQAIGALIDQKLGGQEARFDQKLEAQEARLDQKFEAQEARFDSKLSELISVVNDGFSAVQEQIDELKDDVAELKSDVGELKVEMSKRPTKDEVFGWADRRITDLEIAKDRHDFMHLGELGQLPAPAEINRVLIDSGWKEKLA